MAFLDEAGLAELWSVICGKYDGLYEHTWQRRTNSGYVVSKGAAKNVVLYSTTDQGDAIYNFECADSVNISSTGVVTLNNPQTVRVTSTNGSALNGKYFKGNGYGDSGIYYGTSNTSWITQVDFGLTAQPVTAVNSGAVGAWELVHSPDRNAYPDVGTSDGYEYIYMGVPFDNAAAALKIATGSYTGTGTYGASNPNSIAFDFEPKLVICGIATTGLKPDGTYWSNSFVWYFGTPIQYTGNGKIINMRVDGNTLSWYSSNDMTSQLNYSATAYNYIAIG